MLRSPCPGWPVLSCEKAPFAVRALDPIPVDRVVPTRRGAAYSPPHGDQAPTLGMRSSQTMLSVVIPAHNEETVIERCLRALLDDPGAELDVVIVANGCNDKTVALASRFGSVSVVEIDVASKHAALNVGDRAARHFPRAYVDADIVVSGRALQAVAAAMEAAGAPARRASTAGRPRRLSVARALVLSRLVLRGLVGRRTDRLGCVHALRGRSRARRGIPRHHQRRRVRPRMLLLA